MSERDTSVEREAQIRATVARDDGTSLGVDQGRDLLAMLDAVRAERDEARDLRDRAKRAEAGLAALREVIVAATSGDDMTGEGDGFEVRYARLHVVLADTAAAAADYKRRVRAEVWEAAADLCAKPGSNYEWDALELACRARAADERGDIAVVDPEVRRVR